MELNVEPQINHLLAITDNVGIIEHCSGNLPNFDEGYSVDDNARALQICLRLGQQFPALETVMPIYFNFIKSAVKTDGLYNDLNQDRSWKKDFEIKGEHYGRTLAALGEAIHFEDKFDAEAEQLFHQIYGFVKDSPHPRVAAQIIMGLKYHHSGDIGFWADVLTAQYFKEKSDTWKWFSEVLSYDIGRPILALLTAYEITSVNKYLEIALEALDFLTTITFDTQGDCFVFPGNKGWFTKYGERNIYDQQPIEAGSTTEAYSLAYEITGDDRYRELAVKAYDWYRGKNILKATMINPESGGIFDGFNEREVNPNQGAESVLSYLIAAGAIEKIG